jgi:calcineurin-like phosphoesterase family protein
MHRKSFQSLLVVKSLCGGNHDRGRENAYCKVPGVTGTDFIRKKHNGKSIVMTHYPFEPFREDYHFHGARAWSAHFDIRFALRPLYDHPAHGSMEEAK